MRRPTPGNRVVRAARREKILFAREQRRQATVGEKRLWRSLRDGQLGAKFRRQHPIEKFVLDFYCEECLLAVEIDGPQHEDRVGYDAYRDRRMAARGIRTLRFSSADVADKLSVVLGAIRHAIALAQTLGD